MAIFGNFKGTTQSDFSIGKNDTGSKISTGTQPSSDISNGDLYIDSSNSTLQVYNGDWVSVGSTLTDLNVDSGTLYVDSSNDTVSVGSTSSNDKLFVNGSLRLGTNPTLKFSGAYLDVQHSNGSATQLRIRDNSSGSDPIFKIYSANNTSEVFKVQGETTTFSGNATLTGIDTLRINENGTGLRMTNVGAFDNSGGDFRIFSTDNLILATNGENGTAVTFDQTTKEATFTGAITTTGNITGGTLRADNFTTQNAFAIVGSDNNLIQDTTLSVDPASNYLGINQTSPEVTLHMTGEGAQTAQIRMEQYNDSADAPDVRTRRYRGNIASPSAVQSGDYLYRSNHEYWNGSALIVGGQFAFDNTNNANRTQFTVAVTTDGTSVEASSNDDVQFKIDGNDSGAITFNNAYKFPTSDGSADQVLTTDGNGTLSFSTVSAGGTPGGSNTSIQFNDGGSFGGHANLTYDKSTEVLSVPTLDVTNFYYDSLVEDYGQLDEAVTFTKDYGSVTNSGGAANVTLESFTISTASPSGNGSLSYDNTSGTFTFTPADTSSVGGGISNIVEDTTPQLGGTLDMNNQTVQGNVVPSANNTYSLGSASSVWKDVFIGPGSLYINGKKVIEDASDKITISTTTDQSLKISTSGSGDIELDASGTGVVNFQSNVQADSGVTFSGTGGWTFGSNVNMDNNNINNLDDPVAAQDAATKAYVDAQIQTKDALSELSGTTDDVTEGSTNLYFSNARVEAVSINNLVEDTTPQLGGNLDTNGKFVQGNIIPTANITYDLGSSTNRFRDLYLSNATIDMGITKISVDSNGNMDFASTANSSVKRKLIVDEIELGQGAEKVILRKGSDGKFESKKLNRSSDLESAVKIDFSDNDTDDVAEGSTNLYYSNARVDAYINSSITTTDVSEGDNEYFTNARARSAIGVSGDLSYNSTTGVVSFTERTDAEVRGLISVSGDLSYNSSTGVVSFTERTDSEVRGLISVSGNGISYDSSTGVITSSYEESPTFTGDVVVQGNLTISGSQTIINSNVTQTVDNVFRVNSDGDAQDAGFEANVGGTVKQILYDVSESEWTFGSENVKAGSFEGNVTGTVTGTVSSIANHNTGDLTEGSNLYWTTARGNSAIDSYLTAGTGITISSGTIATTITQYADSDARSAISVSGDLSYNSSTGVITYNAPTMYADSDARSAISVSGDLSYNSSTGVITYNEPTMYANSDVEAYLDSGTSTPTFSSATVTGNITVSGTVDGRDLATDGTKLDGIEAGATADQTASEILTAIKTVDGTGSGLDADTVDGVEASSIHQVTTNASTQGNGRISIGTDGSTTHVQSHQSQILDLNPAGNDIRAGSHFYPRTNNSYDLGTSSYAWRNVYTNDLHLSNEKSDGNSVDGTTGNWTIQEGADDLFIINNKTGKRYKFVLQEVS